MRLDRRIVFGFGAVALACAATGMGVAKQLPRLKSGEEIRAGLGLTGTSGWMVVDLDTGGVLDQGNAARTFVPASVAKLTTAAFALDALGPDHRFETRVLAGGPVRDGQIEGELILQGGGDPELDTDALLPLVAELQARGIAGARGLLADGTALPQVSQITQAQEVDAAYNPSVSGLNLNFNRVHLKWDARKGHELLSVEAAAVRLSPAVETVQVALAPAPGAPLFAFREEDGHELWQMAREAYRGRAARWLPVKRPELYAGEVFGKLAEQHGISLAAPATLGQAPGAIEVLAVHRSRPLSEIFRDMLRHSTNLTAEVAGTAATRAVGVPARTLAESAAVMNAWAGSVAGFAPDDPEFRLVNHSGLTLDSRLSPRRMVELLVALARREAGGTGPHERLPGGIAAYLRPRDVSAKSVPLDYKRLAVVAKTGTMSYVRGLAGYVATPGGRRLAFAIFSNDLDRRGPGPERVDKGWMGRARGFERALIRNWVLRVDGGA